MKHIQLTPDKQFEKSITEPFIVSTSEIVSVMATLNGASVRLKGLRCPMNVLESYESLLKALEVAS